ncbi:MAG: DUF853 domain-containing protein [Spirochaetes bacterium]|nr:DUF853 domain-containing protein [Spirochaetota bacterium]
MNASLSFCRAVEGNREVPLDLSMATRHGLVTGATGTGKTVTLQAMAEAFSLAGVPVLCCDVKGDLSGIAAAGGGNARIGAAFGRLGLPEPAWRACPAAFWEVAGAKGLPLRATVSDLGPLLLARLLGLKDVQSDTLRLLFRIADERGWPVLDLPDLRALVEWATANAASLKAAYGLLSQATLGAVQRSVLVLEDTGAGRFFGEPALDISDLIRVGDDGRGVVNVLAAEDLMAEPQLYATVLLHLLGELFEELPEAGDQARPRLVLLLDEAHLLFDDAPKALVDAVERTARLVRSKGVGLWLVTQSPLDVPESVLGQLGGRVHHALRAYTPRDRKAVGSVAATLRPNPRLDAAAAIVELGVGEALVSFLDEAGRPLPVERVMIVPPASRIGGLSPAERASVIASSPLGIRYAKAIDRESAYELLKGRMGLGTGTQGGARVEDGARIPRDPTIEEIEAELRRLPPEPLYGPEPERRSAPSRARRPAASPAPRRAYGSDAEPYGGLAAELARAALAAAGMELGRQVVRSVLGTRRRR